MQLNITTDYALRTVLCLGKKGNRKNAIQIAQEMVIPERYVLKVLKKLKKSGVIMAFPGNNGGYELAKSLSDISLGEIINIMEPTIKINRCLEADSYCSRNAADSCPVRKIYLGLQEELRKRVMEISLQDVLDDAANR